MKKQSKRLSAGKRYKIERKVREHHRKVRKALKDQPKKIRKDPGIPSFWPHKEKVLEQIQQGNGEQFEGMIQRSLKKQLEYEKWEKTQSIDAREVTSFSDGSKKAFYKEFNKVVDASDVLLYVVDARDPMGCRSKTVEEFILGQNKRMVIVLNKIDLVPKENAKKWVEYLRQEFPTVAFKASTQQQRMNQTCLGADALMKLLKNYCRNHDRKTNIIVGVLGYPNVGKSSLINSLKRSKVCQVGATPGITSSAQDVHLDKNIQLMDCPGIVFSSGANVDKDLFLRNCIRVEDLEDPIAPVESMLKRCSKQQWIDMYKVPPFRDVHEFLLQVARIRGKLRKGGIADLEGAAVCVLHDWNLGKIPFFTVPPSARKNVISSQVVSSFDKEFNVNEINDEQSLVFDQVKPMFSQHSFMKMACDDEEEDMEEMGDIEQMEEMGGIEEMEDIEDVNDSKVRVSRPKTEAPVFTELERSINPQTNLERKKLLKKLKKKKKSVESTEAYDFVDFKPFNSGVEMSDSE